MSQPNAVPARRNSDNIQVFLEFFLNIFKRDLEEIEHKLRINLDLIKERLDGN